MRLTIDFDLSSYEIPKDKNKIFASWIKNMISNYDEEFYERLYKNGPVEKDFTFSVYLGSGAKFNLETITLKNESIRLFFSCYDLQESLIFFNIFTRAKGKEYKYQNLTIVEKGIFIEKDPIFKNKFEIFKTMSPIIVREHKNRDNSSNYYHDISSEKGQQVLLNNLKSKLLNKFGDEIKYDLKSLKIDVLRNKMVTVRHHKINIPSNLSIIKISSKPYILEFIYSSGMISSLNASGYGLLSLM